MSFGPAIATTTKQHITRTLVCCHLQVVSESNRLLCHYLSRFIIETLGSL